MGVYDRGVYVPAHLEVAYDNAAKLTDTLHRLGDLHINIKAFPYGAVGDGVADDSEAIRTALDDIADAGSGSLFFPEGIYRVTLAGRVFLDGFGLGNEFGTLGAGLISAVPSNTRIYGHGSAVIFMEGVPSEDYLGPNQSDHYTIFGMGGGESNITFDGLTFRGDYDFTDGPFYVPDAAPIRAYASTPISDVTVRNCRFENICGFAVHGNALPLERMNVVDCTLVEMASGINVNSDYSLQRGNHLVRSFALECAGAYAVISDNLIEDAVGVGGAAISVGGSTGADADGRIRGVVVSGNTINGNSSGGSGVNLADGIRGAAVTGNTITRCDGGAITMTWSTGYKPSDCIFTGNTIYGNNKVTNPNKAAVTLGQGGRHIVVGNAIFDEDSDADYWQQICLDVYDTDDYIQGNYIATTDRFGGSFCYIIESGASAQLGPNFIGGDGHVLLSGTAQVLTDHGKRSLHANLPAASAYEQGEPFYCMTHKQPLWSDTTNWVEADATNH